MGSSASKSSPATPTHVWKGSAPNGIAQDLVESLQTSHETDASRAQLLELQVQARVAEELKKLQAKEAAALHEAHEKLASPEDSAPAKDRYSVSKDVEALRAKLEGRKKLRELPDSVETARSEVIRCLRDNDRRPLDCWQEVERFKDEVKKLEKGWVDKVVS